MSATPDFVLRIPDDDRLRGQVIVNGLDIADAVHGVDIICTPANTNVEITLRPIRRPVDIEIERAAVTLDPDQVDALVALGWTPPTQTPGSSVSPTPEDPGPEQWEMR